MPFCPECGFDYDEEMSTCPDCQVELVEVFPQADQRDPYRDFVPVFMCYSLDDGILVHSLLEQEGIPCMLTDLENNSSGAKMGKAGEIRILVPSVEIESAGRFIEEALIDGGLQSISGELTV